MLFPQALLFLPNDSCFSSSSGLTLTNQGTGRTRRFGGVSGTASTATNAAIRIVDRVFVVSAICVADCWYTLDEQLSSNDGSRPALSLFAWLDC